MKGWDPTVTKGFNGTVGGILTSPFFPARYPRDLGMEYVITCPAEAPFCRVRVLFSDFQLATVSIIEVKEINIQIWTSIDHLLYNFVNFFRCQVLRLEWTKIGRQQWREIPTTDNCKLWTVIADKILR